MGYYTLYNISYDVPEGVDKKKFSNKLAIGLYAINSEFGFFKDCEIEDLIEDEMKKWYSCEEDMIQLSKLFPEIVFTIEGWGEDREDIWREYFFNGKCQYAPAQIKFAPFDTLLLHD